MIKIAPYEKDFEREYLACVQKKLNSKLQQDILDSCVQFLPSHFFSTIPTFEELVLAPYAKLKEAWAYIRKNQSLMTAECFTQNTEGELEINTLYFSLYKAYDSMVGSVKHGIRMNVKLVQKTGLTVCPYCNRDYINCRSKKASGAQLDHFYPRSQYPIFSVCLYNLVPVCSNCNRIKSDSVKEFASPFDEEIDWEKEIQFTYEPLDMNRKRIVINAEGAPKQNITEMKIEQAYQIHNREVDELLEKVEAYGKTQFMEFAEVLEKAGLSEMEMKQMIFGQEITPERMKTKPLGKMLRDLERELEIYK